MNCYPNCPRKTNEKFYEEFGAVLKEGIHSDTDRRTKIAALARYKTTKSDNNWRSLDEYVKQMPEGQKEIYYLTGDDLNTLINSPLLEKLKEKEYEVLLMTDPVDEWVVQSLTEYDGKPLKSAEKGDLDLGEVDEEQQKSYNALFSFIKGQLEDKIKEVKPQPALKRFGGLYVRRGIRYERLYGKNFEGLRPESAGEQAGC